MFQKFIRSFFRLPQEINPESTVVVYFRLAVIGESSFNMTRGGGGG